MKRIGSALIACGLAGAALAAPPDITAQYGEREDYRMAGVGLRFAPLWEAHWGSLRAATRVEAQFNRFRYDGEKSGARSLEQGGVAANLRIDTGGEGLRPYAEVGLGANLFSRTHLGSKEFSTAFEFNEYLGVGLEFPGGVWAGWRYVHYSNGGIRKPNNGIEFSQLTIGAHF